MDERRYREFRKGRGKLLKEACSRVCEAFGIKFYRDDRIEIYKDEYGWIAIPVMCRIRGRIERYYLMARRYVCNGGIISIEKRILELANEKGLKILMWIAEEDRWYIFRARDILEGGKYIIGYRGRKEYYDFNAYELDIRNKYVTLEDFGGND